MYNQCLTTAGPKFCSRWWDDLQWTFVHDCVSEGNLNKKVFFINWQWWFLKTLTFVKLLQYTPLWNWCTILIVAKIIGNYFVYDINGLCPSLPSSLRVFAAYVIINWLSLGLEQTSSLIPTDKDLSWWSLFTVFITFCRPN